LRGIGVLPQVEEFFWVAAEILDDFGYSPEGAQESFAPVVNASSRRQFVRLDVLPLTSIPVSGRFRNRSAFIPEG
jgi:hypothetical protein